MRILSLVALTGLLTACGATPISIGGKVVDNRGTPVAKAEVLHPTGDRRRRQTNRSGILRPPPAHSTTWVRPSRIPPGVYRIMVRKFDFEDRNFEVNVEG
jgi:hypothetical protein